MANQASQPTEPGWEAAIWSRAYHNADSAISKRKGVETARRSRNSGGTRDLARTCYSNVTGCRFIDPDSEVAKSLLEGLQVGGCYRVYPVPDPLQSVNPWCYVEMAPLHHPAAAETMGYPLLDSQLEQEERIAGNLMAQLKEVHEKLCERCRTTCGSDSDANNCPQHRAEARQILRKYYTMNVPGSWQSHRPAQYFTELNAMFDNGNTMKEIHAHVQREITAHRMDAICTIRHDDDPLVKEYKIVAANMFKTNTTDLVVQEYIKGREKECSIARGKERHEIDQRLASCSSEDEKRAVYADDICLPRPTDGPVMSKLRVKWKGLFDSGIPYHPDICSVVKRDRDDELKVRQDLHEKLAELQRAKAAHDKAKIAKGEKAVSQEVLNRINNLSLNTWYCVCPGCQNKAVPASLEEDTLKCCICAFFVAENTRTSHSYFCAEDCSGGQGTIEHIHKEHPCCADAACVTGENNRTLEMIVTVCVRCISDYDVENCFCTQECFDKNYDNHDNQEHERLDHERAERALDDLPFCEALGRKYGFTAEDVRRHRTAETFEE